ncbi:hypothetical protein [Vibrio anguillarum]|uniref:Uncharacterized protein n=1 Tax=Vibrio anguillarum TaxID=55601 RepID=A0A7U6FS02_VIBAN|nr:hypothetical protein [Vibrio anguillarum]AZS26244.1 hypothetical protein DYL72_15155 [Vibrio anguillarum]MBF4374525.1 hypothetical protein [Vibrio anguillarum]MBF4436498.1 hypothetical protein [Vibrio anguillarum]
MASKVRFDLVNFLHTGAQFHFVKGVQIAHMATVTKSVLTRRTREEFDESIKELPSVEQGVWFHVFDQLNATQQNLTQYKEAL